MTTAVEEIVRWATPVIHFRRTATADTTLGGQPIRAGEKIVMWYTSANRAEAVSGEPAYLSSNVIDGIKHLPCAFTPGGA